LSAVVEQLIPFVQVSDVARSIDFYARLGFEVADTYVHDDVLDFASLASGNARTMLVRAAGPVESRRQSVSFYLYTADLDRLRAELLDQGIGAGPIVDGSPGPKREMSVRDPDGYRLLIAEGRVE
jgi:catechol 2,3-dioxygenase-like lactoylglutathione lyase family enzyme